VHRFITKEQTYAQLLTAVNDNEKRLEILRKDNEQRREELRRL